MPEEYARRRAFFGSVAIKYRSVQASPRLLCRLALDYCFRFMPFASAVTSSLLFVCAERNALPAIRREGIPGGVSRHVQFDDARRRCAECILVLDASGLDERESTARAAIANLDPYKNPVPVTAGGGFVVRNVSGEVEVLIIFRNQVWDLPKGKIDPGETIEECARREVCEELGIDDVVILGPLGRTIHGYPYGREYAVKTTHWFSMTTKASSFTPQKKEKIEAVEWVRLSEARERLGFETLRKHLDAVADALRIASENSEP